MTAISIPTRIAPRSSGFGASPRTRLRLTTRGRRVLAAMAALPAAVALSIAMIGGGAAIANRDAGAPVGTFETITVDPGDSLWSIAQEVAPAADPRDVVDAITRLNALDGSVLQAGRTLAIPLEFTADR